MFLKVLKNIFSSLSDQELRKIINNNTLLIDVRTPEEFAHNQIKGSINIPLGELQNKIQTIDKNKTIVVFCASGSRSAYAKALLEKGGIARVYDGKSVSKINRIINTHDKENYSV
ncbi:MAG: rhodanese-like domain-containing protein [Bacteroidota bacterium]|nr:rhodanese-like domain-containing protein [Bacteroidota bacterium]